MNPENANPTPAAPVANPAQPSVQTPPVQEQIVNQPPKKSSSKMLIVLIAVVVIVLLAALGGWFVMGRNASSPAPTPTQAPVVQETITETPQAGSGLLAEKAYVDSSAGFEITPPAGWTTQKNPGAGVIVMFVNPKSPGTSINVVSTPSEGLSLDEYVDVNKEQLKKLLANYVPADDEQTTINGEEGYYIGGTFGNPKVKNKQLLLVSGDKAYVVTATSTETNWDENTEAFDASFNSFVINN
jgi:hypothetical protein